MEKPPGTAGKAPTQRATSGTVRKAPATAAKAPKPVSTATATSPPTGDPGAATAAPAATARAEEIVDVLGQRAGRYAAAAGRQLTRLAARAREEGEDILMEAQHLRGKRP